ncbi:MAG: hypothetical protein NZ807_02735 [Dehalococcoidia bacterium]|nr:hypothetical protein [Dehalococcoidia bacterium]
MTYTELVAAVKEYVQNTEATFVNNIPNFIRSSEDRVFMNVQTPSAFLSTTGLSATSGVVADFTVVDMFEVFDVRVDASGQLGTNWTTLLRKDWDFLREAYPNQADSLAHGTPKYYAVSNADDDSSSPRLTIRLAPIPDKTYNVSIDFYGSTNNHLSGSVAETWLSVAWPQTLLYGCLVDAYTFMKGEPDLVSFYDKMFTQGLEKIGMMSTGEQRNNLKPPMRV